MKKNWWKALSIVLLLYVFIAGFLSDVPRLHILNETIRNLYFHVGMWFGMIAMAFTSVIYSIRYLKTHQLIFDIKAAQFANVGVLFGILGVVTGMLWGNYTWGHFWPDDPKIHGAAVTVLVYLALFILRNGIVDLEKKARVGSAYNILAFVLLVVFVIIYPRLTQSLHPGNGGNPGFGRYDLNNSMKIIFYPAVLAWILLGTWIATLNVRVAKLKNKKILRELDS